MRDDEQLNERLTASKSQRMNGEADFKTLADVLIQCTFSHGLKTKVRLFSWYFIYLLVHQVIHSLVFTFLNLYLLIELVILDQLIQLYLDKLNIILELFIILSIIIIIYLSM